MIRETYLRYRIEVRIPKTPNNRAIAEELCEIEAEQYRNGLVRWASEGDKTAITVFGKQLAEGFRQYAGENTLYFNFSIYVPTADKIPRTLPNFPDYRCEYMGQEMSQYQFLIRTNSLDRIFDRYRCPCGLLHSSCGLLGLPDLLEIKP